LPAGGDLGPSRLVDDPADHDGRRRPRRVEHDMNRYVFDFTDGNRDMADLLGGKGANLAEMTRLGLPVPAGFTITTEACRAYLATQQLPEGLVEEIGDHLRRVERVMGRRFGDPA